MLFFLRTAVVSGLRSRSFQAILILGVLMVAVAYLASMFSPRQPQTVALDVGISGLRITMVLLALFWTQELFGREIDSKSVMLTLAYPVSRAAYVIGRFAGIAQLLLIAAMLLATLLWLSVLTSGGGYAAALPVALGTPYWATIAGIYLDVLVVMAFAFCVTTTSTVLMLPLALGGMFAVSARLLGLVADLLLVRHGDGDQGLAEKFGPVIEVLRWVLPDLSRLDWRDWPLYQQYPGTEGILWSVVMALAFSGALLAIAVNAFNKREFY